jgi:hypothetical protein
MRKAIKGLEKEERYQKKKEANRPTSLLLTLASSA